VNIVQEYCVVGDLERLLAARREHGVGFPTPQEVVFLAAQLLVALRFVHGQHILLRDVKPLNTALVFWWQSDAASAAEEGEAPSSHVSASKECIIAKMLRKRPQQQEPNPPPPCVLAAGASLLAPCSSCLAFRVSLRDLQVKLIDVGVARTLSSGTHHSLAQTTVGSPHYLSPEMVDGEGCSYPADIWAAGAIIWELCGNGQERLFGGENMLAVVRAISAGKVRPLPPAIEESAPAIRSMLECMIQLEPAKRLSADELLKKFFPRR
jgi:serine/threonine protein kinase